MRAHERARGVAPPPDAPTAPPAGPTTDRGPPNIAVFVVRFWLLYKRRCPLHTARHQQGKTRLACQIHCPSVHGFLSYPFVQQETKSPQPVLDAEHSLSAHNSNGPTASQLLAYFFLRQIQGAIHPYSKVGTSTRNAASFAGYGWMGERASGRPGSRDLFRAIERGGCL